MDEQHEDFQRQLIALPALLEAAMSAMAAELAEKMADFLVGMESTP